MPGYSFVDDAQTATPKVGGGYSFVEDPKKEVGLIDRAKASIAGVNRGFFSDLIGLPVDTAANVVDLAKAGIGFGASKITGKAPPDWTQPYNREEIPGTADWIAKNINRGSSALGMSSPIDNPNPQDPLSRIVYSGGRVGGASIVPNPRAAIGGVQQLVNVGMGVAGGLSAGSVGEIDPEYAGLAGMLPQLVAAASIAGTKKVARGNDNGRKEMAQRMQDFKNAGVDNPSLGLATGNGLIQGIENIASVTPGSVGLFERNKQALLQGLQNKTNSIRDEASPVFGPVATGEVIQADLKGPFKDRIGNTYSALNDRVESAVGPTVPVSVEQTIEKAKQLTTPIVGAESTSSNFINPRIAKIGGDLAADSGGRPEQIINGKIVFPDGAPALQTVIPATDPQGVPFSALKDLRTKIGKESQSNAIMGTPEQAEFKQLYGSMSQDMKNAVAAADVRNPGTNGVEAPATQALNRANTFYSRAMNRADELNSLANRNTPEGAYGAVAQSLNAGPSVYERLRGVVQPETRQKIVATIVDDLGMAKSGQQGVEGDTWSPRVFLTNYNKMDGSARSELFKRIPGGSKMADQLVDIAKASDMVSQASKVWANPSGTAPAMMARGALGTLAVGATAGLFYTPLLIGAAGTGAGLLAANQASKRLLLNPKFVNWLAKVPEVRPQDAQSYTQRLIANAKMTNDKQFQQDVADYLASVEQRANDGNNTDNQ